MTCIINTVCTNPTSSVAVHLHAVEPHDPSLLLFHTLYLNTLGPGQHISTAECHEI